MVEKDGQPGGSSLVRVSGMADMRASREKGSLQHALWPESGRCDECDG